MEELYSFGISDETVKIMLEVNPLIKYIEKKELIEKKNILIKIKCDDIQIINIVGSNPMFLTKTNEEIINLINCLYEKGFNSLNVLLDSNPYILNLEPFEINNYFENRIKKGENILEIIDDLDSNPILFNEM